MKLTRRDAIAALVAGGVGTAAAGIVVLESDRRLPGERGNASPLDGYVETVVATADVIYPSGLDGIPVFVEAYVSGLPGSDRDGMGAAAERLDVGALRRYNRPFADLLPGLREDVLYDLGVHVAASDPDGNTAERIRYYLVNELLYALFTSPKGSRLVGIDNPVGYPGGYESYREEP